MMELGVLLEGIAPVAEADRKTGITDIQADSRRVSQGALFLALRGGRVDGHTFIEKAVAAGCAAVLAEDSGSLPSGITIPVIIVPDLKGQLALLGARFFGDPSRDMIVVGITGTNGKTSTTYFCREIFLASGYPTGLIGTIENIIGDVRETSVNTTPDGLELQRLFHRMKGAGSKVVVMEVSSHALALGRVRGVHFDTAVFTNITEDHLDFHGTMEAYVDAKLSFLDYMGASAARKKTVIVNTDIEYRKKVFAAIRASGLEMRTFGLHDADYAAADPVANLDMTGFRLVSPWGSIPVSLAARGYFSILNALGAMAAAMEAGITPETAADGVSRVRIPGRFEIVPGDAPFLVVVDYAHTDDALDNLIASARRLEPARVLTVFGCGGDRDRAKRPLMGRAASAGSDMVFVTSDNPRSEDPQAIIDDILPGITLDSDRRRVIPDRASAIRAAVQEAREGDIVLIAGKGHEDYQIFADRTIHFSDREVAAEALAGSGGSVR